MCTGLIALASAVPFSAGGQDGPVIVYGDSRHGHDTHREIVSAIVAEHPRAVFHTGDYVTTPDKEDQWDAFFDIIAPLRDVAPFYPARGNHDGDGASFASRFALAEGVTWYAVELPDMRFLVLDSNDSLSPASPQYQWLVDALTDQEGDGRYLCVVLHHPIYNSGGGGHTEDELGLILSIEPLLVAHGVDLVFAGHVHTYERLEKDGVTYIITGGGGAGLYSQTERSERSILYVMKNHYVRLTPGVDGLSVEAISTGGSVIDSFTIIEDRPE
jgi:predicted phosphodiesterase